MLPPTVCVEDAVLPISDERLLAPLPGELASLGDCVAKRRCEFMAGRLLARRALQELGVAPTSIPISSSRAPAWPPGVVGSISHTATRCVVAVARARDVASVGIDVELDRPVDVSVLPHILTQHERARLAPVAQTLGIAAEHVATVCFSAKEAFYKAQAPLTGAMLDFLDVEVELGPVGFCVSVLRDIGDPWLSRPEWQGRYARVDGHVLTAMWMQPSAQASR